MRRVLVMCVLASGAALHAQTSSLERVTLVPSQVRPADRQWLLRSWRIDIFGATLAELIGSAYQLKPALIIAPQWMHEVRFDLSALLPDGASEPDIPALLRRLLAERFDLRTHTESRPQPAWALAVADSGIKMKPAAGAVRSLKNVPQGMAFVDNPIGALLLFNISTGLNLDRPVLDRTGLTGLYEGVIDSIPGRPNQGDARFAENLRTAALAKLGLKLEPATVPGEVLVVDSAERQPRTN